MKRGQTPKGKHHKSWHSPSYHQNLLMEKEGVTWTPPRDNRDNRAANYESSKVVNEAYQKVIKKYERTMAWIADQYEPGEEIDSDNYLFLKLPIEEKLKLPDSEFIYEGMHKSLMPAIVCVGGKKTRDKLFSENHKEGRCFRIRVPSLKRGNSTWVRFYNEFPWVAAEVRYGVRRFINGAKLKYIW